MEGWEALTGWERVMAQALEGQTVLEDAGDDLSDGSEARNLDLLDLSLGWLLVLIAAVVLSFAATVRQREALCLSLSGEKEAAEEVGCVLPIRKLVAVMVSLAVAFFFLVSLDTADQTQDPAALRSACLNRWASLFVLAAALLRLVDVSELCRQAEEESA